MISKKTVLVLGAGASAPYKFPLGIQLRNQIARLATQDYQVLTDAGFSPGDVREFAYRLSRSGYTSADWFLADFPEFIEVGKAAIAAHLVPLERDVNLWPPKASVESWYEFLLNTLDDADDFKENELSVVTFNYDRSLEHYLYTALSVRRDSEEEAAADFNSVEIVHVHGSLGEYPVLGTEGQAYHEVESAEAVMAAAERIVILSEADDDTPEFIRARELLDDASRILFLGFGYHGESLRRLGPWTEETRGQAQVTGTLVGIPDRRWKELVQPFNGCFTTVGGGGVYPFLTAYIGLAD